MGIDEVRRGKRSDHEAGRSVVRERGDSDAAQSSLLERIAAGESQLIDAFVSQYRGLIWSLARRFCANPADAEDAVQDIFIDLWQNGHRYRSEIASEASFVAMVARRRLIDRLRKTKRDKSVPLPEAADLHLDALSHDDDAAGCTEAVQAARLLETLRPEQSEVLKLSLYSGYSHADVATETGLPLGTVKTHIRRGLMELRQQVESASALPVKRGRAGRSLGLAPSLA